MISVIIPSLNEPYLEKTVADIQQHAVGEIEILVGDDAVEKLGQRALMNKLARQAKGEYIMKCDAHCSFGPGFDKIMLEDMDDKTIMAPFLLPLDGETWTLSNNRHSSFVFDTNLVMHHAPNNDELVNETMCLQGSCFLTTTENYWKWNLCDQSYGSWGQQAVELGIQAYLHGGVCKTTKKTYYGHVFRHNEIDFPYKRDNAPGKRANELMKQRFLNKSIAGLIEKFDFPLDWTPEKVNELPENVKL